MQRHHVNVNNGLQSDKNVCAGYVTQEKKFTRRPKSYCHCAILNFREEGRHNIKVGVGLKWYVRTMAKFHDFLCLS